MNGKYRFIALWSCGCVLSERALKEVDSEACHNCGVKFSNGDVIVLNPEEDDIDKMKTNMKDRREKQKLLKKERKEKKSGDKRKVNGTAKEDLNSKLDGNIAAPKAIVNGLGEYKNDKMTLPNGSSKSNINGEAKKVKLDPQRSGSKKTSYIDPKKSKVYKNLFTSSEPRDKDKTAHWITYNPYHL